VYDELLRTRRVDGFVVSGTNLDDPRIAYLIHQQVPFVSFGRSTANWPFAWVDTDGRAGLYTATRYLAELGHERIGFLGWPPPSLAGAHRESGYRDALRELRLPPGPIWYGTNSEETGREALQRWLALPALERPTGLLVVSDMMAIGVLNEAEHHGVEIGRELSIIGFDDAPPSQYLRPALTTLRQPIAEIAQAVIDLFEAQLSRVADEDSHRLFAPELVVRQSTGRVPAVAAR
jgi:LacI family transcriptional regulator